MFPIYQVLVQFFPNMCPVFRTAEAQLDATFTWKPHFRWRHDYISDN